MKFLILNEIGNALSMEELNKEAAEFFGVPYKEEEYAKPWGKSLNWCYAFDTNMTTLSHKGLLQWEDLIKQILQISVFYNTNSFEGLNRIIQAYKPYIELCYHWKSKGYTPVCL